VWCVVPLLLVFFVKVIKFLPQPPSHHRPSMLILFATTPPLFAYFVTLSSRHSSRAALTRRLVASVGCVRCPPSHLPVSSSFKLSRLSKLFLSFIILSSRHLSRRAAWLPRWSARGFLSRLVIQSEFFSFDFDMVYAVTLLSISDFVGLATL
jgi:hypothetical protein